MKPTYYVESSGTCDEYDGRFWIEGQSIGFLDAFIVGADEARTKGKELEMELRARITGTVRNVRTHSTITRQR